jgi:hypothetical protein
MPAKPVLFFDTFIIDSSLGVDKNSRRSVDEFLIRNSNSIYKFQKKIEVVKYVLTTYSYIDWAGVFINFECENPSETHEFHEFCVSLFPSAIIDHKRSSTELSYYQALSKVYDKFEDCWVFFCPNNDHPYVASIDKLSTFIDAADDLRLQNPGAITSILYSHYYESMKSSSPFMSMWGYYAGIFPKIIHENDEYFIVKYNKALLDSVHIYRLRNLLEIFSGKNTIKRVIRLEDTKSYLSNEFEHLCILPKSEICRHFDGYFHLKNISIENVKTEYLAPLFIPKGFYEKNIKIAYGKIDRSSDHISINPDVSQLSYLNINYFDSNMSHSNIPLAWRERIASVDYSSEIKVISTALNTKHFINLIPSSMRYLFYYLLTTNLVYIKRLVRLMRAKKI